MLSLLAFLGSKDTDMWAKGVQHAGCKWPCLRSSLQGCSDEEGRRCERHLKHILLFYLMKMTRSVRKLPSVTALHSQMENYQTVDQ